MAGFLFAHACKSHKMILQSGDMKEINGELHLEAYEIEQLVKGNDASVEIESKRHIGTCMRCAHLVMSYVTATENTPLSQYPSAE